MPPKLLESQFQTLEPLNPSVEPGAVVSVELPLGTCQASPLSTWIKDHPTSIGTHNLLSCVSHVPPLPAAPNSVTNRLHPGSSAPCQLKGYFSPPHVC